MKKSYYQTVHQIIRTGHWITDQVSKELKEFEVSEPQYNVLRILKGAGKNPCSVQYISERMIQRSSNVTRILDKLIARNFVERRECKENRRKMDVTITQDGLNYLKKLDRRLESFHKPFSENLSEKESFALTALIQKMFSNE